MEGPTHVTPLSGTTAGVVEVDRATQDIVRFLRPSMCRDLVSLAARAATQRSGRLRRIGRREGQLGESRHALTLQRLAVTVKLTNTHLAA